MTFQVTCVVKDANHIHTTPALAIDQEMPGLSDNTEGASCPSTAEGQVIGADASRQLWARLRPGPLRVGRDVANRLLQKIAVTGGRALAESLLGPCQGFPDVVSSGRGQDHW